MKKSTMRGEIVATTLLGHIFNAAPLSFMLLFQIIVKLLNFTALIQCH